MRPAWITTATRVVVALVLAGSTACRRPEADWLSPPEPPIVWPDAPDQPRVRFMGELHSSDQIGVVRTLAEQWNALLYGPEPPMHFVTPYAVAIDESCARVAVADPDATCVWVIDLKRRTWTPRRELGADREPIAGPVAVAWAGEELYVADAKRGAVAVLDSAKSGRWMGREELNRPSGLAYCPANRRCYVADAGLHEVLALDPGGEIVQRFGSRGAGPGEFNFPTQVAFDGRNTLAVADSLNFRVQLFDLEGACVGGFGRKGDAAGDLALPKGLAFDREGHLWVVDAQFENVQAFKPDGTLLLAVGREGAQAGEFSLPAGAAVDGQDRLWVADTHNRRIQVFELLAS
jgi:DNA-binding beta-propeller fold protein YncE